MELMTCIKLPCLCCYEQCRLSSWVCLCESDRYLSQWKGDDCVIIYRMVVLQWEEGDRLSALLCLHLRSCVASSLPSSLSQQQFGAHLCFFSNSALSPKIWWLIVSASQHRYSGFCYHSVMQDLTRFDFLWSLLELKWRIYSNSHQCQKKTTTFKYQIWPIGSCTLQICISEIFM